MRIGLGTARASASIQRVNIYVYRSTTSTNFPTVNPLQAGRDSKCIQDRDVDQSRQRGSDYRKYHVHGLRGVFSEP